MLFSSHLDKTDKTAFQLCTETDKETLTDININIFFKIGRELNLF